MKRLVIIVVAFVLLLLVGEVIYEASDACQMGVIVRKHADGQTISLGCTK